MIIGKHEVPNKMVLIYCKTIKQLEQKFDSDLEKERVKIHDRIFEYVGCHRALYTRDDREFNKALNYIVLELTNL